MSKNVRKCVKRTQCCTPRGTCCFALHHSLLKEINSYIIHEEHVFTTNAMEAETNKNQAWGKITKVRLTGGLILVQPRTSDYISHTVGLSVGLTLPTHMLLFV